MFLINRLSRIPPGTIPIYLNRLQNRNRKGHSNLRYFQSSSSTNSTKSFLFNFSTDDTSSASSNETSLSSIKTQTPESVAIKWFYATDVPNSQPALYNYQKTKDPTKFLPFSDQDSNRLEQQFQNYKQKDSTIPGFEPHLVPVHEDRLFECDLTTFELKPIYWEGAVYEIRRGLWFDKDNMPLKQELADELEQAYLEIAPFQKNFENLQDTMELTQKLTTQDKTAVFTKEDSVYLLENNSSFTSFQVNYLIKSVIPPLLPVEKFSRGYKVDLSKEKNNKKQDAPRQKLDSPKLENEIKNDYLNKSDRFDNDREVDHLVICVHGIGQILGTKFESINFIHTINVLRQTMKKIFKESDLLQKIAYPEEELQDDNCKIQVLPIVWRHNVDLNSAKKLDDKITLSDITIDGIRPLRNMLGDIVIDVLLYYEPHYMQMILNQVVKQTNEVYDKYIEKHPNFNGKVSLIGHSLGSAICFDILCNQPDSLDDIDPTKHLKFDVENFFAIGSPIGVFSLLKDTEITPRSVNKQDSKSPKVKNFYNIFHPCDPIAYRIEPLIRKEFAGYKPAIIPFASKNNIDSQIQNLTQIGDELTNKVIKNLNTALKTITPTKRQKLDSPEHVSSVSSDSLNVMTKFNYSGRIDYALPASIFDISIVSAINSHVSYFEEPNISGFLIRELLLNKKIVKDKKVLLMDEDEEYFTVDEEN